MQRGTCVFVCLASLLLFVLFSSVGIVPVSADPGDDPPPIYIEPPPIHPVANQENTLTAPAEFTFSNLLQRLVSEIQAVLPSCDE